MRGTEVSLNVVSRQMALHNRQMDQSRPHRKEDTPECRSVGVICHNSQAATIRVCRKADAFVERRLESDEDEKRRVFYSSVKSFLAVENSPMFSLTLSQ